MSSFWKRSILRDSSSVNIVAQSTYAIRFQAELPTNEATLRKNMSEDQTVLLNKVNFYDDLVKIQTAFQTVKASIRAMKQKE